MGDRNAVFIGCDVGDRFTEMCVIDRAGAVIEARRIRTTKPMLVRQLAKFGHAKVVLEAGSHSRWIEEALTDAGHEVVVANPRQIELIWKRHKKTDRSDAVLLARLARVDVSLVAPVQQRTRSAQAKLAVLRSRDALVTARTKLVNHVRGQLKQFGIRLQGCSTSTFATRAREAVPDQLGVAMEPVLDALDAITEQIAVHEKAIAQQLKESPAASRLADIDGVGPITALAFTLTIEEPAKFKKSRIVPAFLGLVPAKEQSGDSDPQKHITKAGNPFMRRLLVQCAHHLLGTFGPDCDLRRWGLSLCERGGGAAKKRAIIAVARKLAVVMHRIWVTGQPYDPHFNAALA